MHTFVTGATGFIGQWLVKRLLEDGHKVDVLVRKPHLYNEKHENLTVIKGDITDPKSLEQIKPETDALFHLAGVIAYRKVDRPMMDKVNIEGTQNIIDACINSKVKKLIHMSTVCAVGFSEDGSQPLNEDSPYTISKYNFGYFETKRKAEELVLAATQKGLIKSTILNPSTVYGAGDAEKGSRKIQLKVARGQFPFYTKGGVSIIGVHEVVDCLVKAVGLGRNGERYILAGENITIEQLFKYIAEFSHQKPPSILLPNFVLMTLGQIGSICSKLGISFPVSKENVKISSFYHWFDSSKAQSTFNFEPQKASVYIKESVDWVIQHKL